MSHPILVTGGAGFVGSHLVERLLKDGETVVVLDDFSTGDAANLAAVSGHPRLRVVHGRVSEHPGLVALVAECGFIFHLAAAVGVELVVNSPIRTIETNLNETEAILMAAAAEGVPCLFASTSEVYGKSSRPEFSEEDDLLIGPPTLGRWGYACSKLMDEFLALAYMRERGLPVTIARLFNTVGPRQTGRYGMVLPRFVAAALAGEPIRVYGDGGQSRCFCHIADAVEAFSRLRQVPAARGEVVNVGHDEPISIRKLAERVRDQLGSRSTLEFVPYEAAYAAGFEDMRQRKPALAKLERLTGFRPRRTLDEIIAEVAETLRQT
ncbi:MAG TPA: NAD-dependent epimerase/dehydratase family protein [Verrucomicrobiota bacterium]|nr:nucleoside-diphosphate sugar epimerase [Verrucomicrobiales bacterium]HRI12159.1 NAD-dependent epimerase/dehydratase family protein [Verrucomicrobiota bacterium]